MVRNILMPEIKFLQNELQATLGMGILLHQKVQLQVYGSLDIAA